MYARKSDEYPQGLKPALSSFKMSELKLRPPKRLLKSAESQLQGLKPFFRSWRLRRGLNPALPPNWVFEQPAKGDLWDGF
jgi:hypothetical protein